MTIILNHNEVLYFNQLSINMIVSYRESFKDLKLFISPSKLW